MSTEDLLTSEISSQSAHPEHKLRKQERPPTATSHPSHATPARSKAPAPGTSEKTRAGASSSTRDEPSHGPPAAAPMLATGHPTASHSIEGTPVFLVYGASYLCLLVVSGIVLFISTFLFRCTGNVFLACYLCSVVVRDTAVHAFV
jgi:hypothetical protein